LKAAELTLTIGCSDVDSDEEHPRMTVEWFNAYKTIEITRLASVLKEIRIRDNKEDMSLLDQSVCDKIMVSLCVSRRDIGIERKGRG